MTARRRALSPAGIAPPFARYSHGIAVEGAGRIVAVSGQLGLARDGTVPPDAEAQARICLANGLAILAEAGLGPEHVLRVTGFVTDRAHMAGYMRARDAAFAGVDPPPASTLIIVSGFTRPEFLVEVELLAAG
ncbi:MAG: enamine deaminase RidA [Paracoccaceae bacterium]|nr:MAG: RidA family protein [Alphaproteobacteria bacterium]GIX13763.1 MAG: enamine deaminase RidA [Paracoccaceae bacterium]